MCVIPWVFLGMHPIIAFTLGFPLAIIIGLGYHIKNDPVKEVRNAMIARGDLSTNRD